MYYSTKASDQLPYKVLETLVATVLVHTAVSTSHKAGCYDTCGYTHAQIT